VVASDGTYTETVQVTWDSAADATYYEVYRAESAGGTKTLLGSPTGTSYDDDSAVVGTTYYYWLVACNTWGCSDYSAHDTGYRPSSVGTVSGSVILERRTSSAGATVSVGTLATTTDASGAFGPSDIPAGTHTIEATHPSYLRTWRSLSLVAGEMVVLPDVTLLGGDVNQNDHIYIEDLVLEGQAWNTTPADAAWFDAGDITDDQVINILDMVAVQYNFNAVARSSWGAALAQGSPELDRAGTLTSQDRADVTTQVVVSPSQASQAGVGEVVELDIEVQDVSDLFGALLRLTFDPSVVQVQDGDPRPSSPGVQIRSGDLLDPNHQFVAVNEADNATGEIEFAVTQLRPAKARSGSGVLATVILKAVGQGTSPVQLVEVRLLDNTPKDPQEIPAGTQDGEIMVEGRQYIYLPLVLRSFGP
jgi:hypothetical protein